MTPALQIENLKKTYGNQKALQGISLTLKSGDFFALLWENGAGKTTTIGIITGLVNKSEGKIHVFGKDIDTDFMQAKNIIGVVPQEFNFDIFETVENIPKIQAGYYGIPPHIASQRTKDILKKLWLWEKRHFKASQLSGGMKRRLMFARALIHKPKLLILDEPTAWVDVELRTTMWDFLVQLNQSGTTILLTTHYLEEAENLCNTLAIIQSGKILRFWQKLDILRELESETFTLDVKNFPLDLPYDLKKFSPFHPDENTLEITVHKKATLNDLFHILNVNKIDIMSIRSKRNRLEELFLTLTGK